MNTTIKDPEVIRKWSTRKKINTKKEPEVVNTKKETGSGQHEKRTGSDPHEKRSGSDPWPLTRDLWHLTLTRKKSPLLLKYIGLAMSFEKIVLGIRLAQFFAKLIAWPISLCIIPRILDILILQDKTLFCACVDIFKENGVFWRQHLLAVRVWTWPKYNKHHHDLKNQLCRFIDMYTGKIFWPTAPCRGCPKKEIWGQVRSCSVRFLTQTRLALLSSAQLFNVFFYRLG